MLYTRESAFGSWQYVSQPEIDRCIANPDGRILARNVRWENDGAKKLAVDHKNASRELSKGHKKLDLLRIKKGSRVQKTLAKIINHVNHFQNELKLTIFPV